MAVPCAKAREKNGRVKRWHEAMCMMAKSAGKVNDLPLEFFARGIWQESDFQSDAVGTATRSGQREQGHRAVMPGTRESGG